ncbi:TetR/AcrR family transcriptional regulator [Streptomyces sp. MA15]|uniref:TetR/AcrR family transcriptional regulator n=1 Tax=Streptomyces sp. MA15 TaxID=3055061 RepID=UPI0025B15787|nr:TetR/AcrR family transcriptional regulator [Streptomyces sp. MA15]MDN3272400.1 TetR/AcrR family transcriptional regulator [Streptomyces sp. MA15]
MPPTPEPGAQNDGGRKRGGRKRDPQRDAVILEATLDVLAEVGYTGMTMDLVAARARAGKATMYRRWPSKDVLVLDAVALLQSQEPGVSDLLDTGSLRGDFIAMTADAPAARQMYKLRVMRGLSTVTNAEPETARAITSAIADPWSHATHKLLQRAVKRGEIADHYDFGTIALVVPSICAYRTLMHGGEVNQKYLMSLIDALVLPAVGLTGHLSARI